MLELVTYIFIPFILINLLQFYTARNLIASEEKETELIKLRDEAADQETKDYYLTKLNKVAIYQIL